MNDSSVSPVETQSLLGNGVTASPPTPPANEQEANEKTGLKKSAKREEKAKPQTSQQPKQTLANGRGKKGRETLRKYHLFMSVCLLYRVT